LSFRPATLTIIFEVGLTEVIICHRVDTSEQSDTHQGENPMKLTTPIAPTTVNPVTELAKSVLNTIMPGGVFVGNSESAVLELVARPEKTEAENMEVVTMLIKLVAVSAHDGMRHGFIQDRVLLELLWLGYWQPEL
jgi:hypothetical protein